VVIGRRVIRPPCGLLIDVSDVRSVFRFRVIAHRHRLVTRMPRSSIASPSTRTSSKPAPPGYSDASIVDRITVNAHILETGTESYQLRTSKTHHRKRA